MKPKDLEKMYEHLVKETDKVMDDLRKLLQKQKNEEEQVLYGAHLEVQQNLFKLNDTHQKVFVFVEYTTSLCCVVCQTRIE